MSASKNMGNLYDNDALVHERVYKAAIPEEKAYGMIENGECGVFSPELMHCLTNCRKTMASAF